MAKKKIQHDFYEEVKKLSTELKADHNRFLSYAIRWWVSKTIGKVPGGSEETDRILEERIGDVSPFEGRWVNSKKTQGVIRPVGDPTCYQFSDFWKHYDCKLGSRADAERMWCKLPEEIRGLIKDTLPGYVADTTNQRGREATKTYRANATRYINGRYWEKYVDKIDEIRQRQKKISSEWLEPYQKYLTFVQTNFPEVLEAKKEATLENYVEFKTRSYHKSAAKVGLDAEMRVFKEAHDRSKATGTEVWGIFLNLIKAKIGC